MFKIKGSAGHGKGLPYKRGGLLFNEGDNNLVISNLVKKEFEKYTDVDFKEIRKIKGNYDHDPYIRSKWGEGADLFYSFHSNGFHSKIRGVEIILSYQSMQYYSFAKELVATISRVLDTPNRGVKFRNYATEAFTGYTQAKSTYKNWYGELRNNKAKCAILVEHFFHTNLQDSKNFLERKEVLAAEIVRVIAKHFGLKKKAPTISSAAGLTTGIYRVTVRNLNIRQLPNKDSKLKGSITDKGAYTITEVKNNWGKLKSGIGWIYLKGYTTKVK